MASEQNDITKALLALATRLESASGPSKELDALIWWEAGQGKIVCPQFTSALDAVAHYFGTHGSQQSFSTYFGPEYTSDVRAAIGLVGQDYAWASGNCGEESGPWACLTERADPCRDFSSDAATPAMALCAAALRAFAVIAKLGQSA